MIFDTHCHLGYDEDRDPAGLRQRAELAGVSTLLDVAIVRLLRDPEASRKLGAAAKARAEVRFTQAVHVAAVQAIYDSLGSLGG